MFQTASGAFLRVGSSMDSMVFQGVYMVFGGFGASGALQGIISAFHRLQGFQKNFMRFQRHCGGFTGAFKECKGFSKGF